MSVLRLIEHSVYIFSEKSMGVISADGSHKDFASTLGTRSFAPGGNKRLLNGS